MASYTMPLSAYIERFSQNEDSLSHRERIEKGRKNLFDFDYPIFDNNYKKVFETNLIRKFYMREIGFESEELFKFHLETWLNINMPYFNKLFESEMFKYDPLINSEMNVTHNLKKDKEQNADRDIIGKFHNAGSSSGSGTSQLYNISNSFDRQVESDLPDNRLKITAGTNAVGIIEYASMIIENSRHSTSLDRTKNTHTEKHADSNDTSQKDKMSTDINEIEDFIEHRKGKIGVVSYPEMIVKYRQSFLRIENLIHNEIQKLFMLVY